MEGGCRVMNLSNYWLSSAKVKNRWSHMSAPALRLNGGCGGKVLLSLPLPINK